MRGPIDKWQRLENCMGEMLSTMGVAFSSWTARERDALRLGLHLGHWEEAAVEMEPDRAMSHWRRAIGLIKRLTP